MLVIFSRVNIENNLLANASDVFAYANTRNEKGHVLVQCVYSSHPGARYYSMEHLLKLVTDGIPTKLTQAHHINTF